MTSTCRGTGTGPKRWSRRPAGWAFRSWPARRCRSPGAFRPWSFPGAAEVQEAVCVGYGGIDSYDFHGLESFQCLVERRRGGETGVTAVQAVRGSAVWDAAGRGGSCERRALPELLEACLCRSFTLASPRPGYGHVLPELAQMPALARDPVMYRIEYVDGLKSTLLMLSGLVTDFTVAVRIKQQAELLSTQMYLPGLTPGQTLPNFFSPLAHHIETLFLTGKAPLPRRANAADHRDGRRRDRLADPGSEANRDAPP